MSKPIRATEFFTNFKNNDSIKLPLIRGSGDPSKQKKAIYFGWKKWYWKFGQIANILTVLFLVIFLICHIKVPSFSEESFHPHLIWIIVCSTTVLIAFWSTYAWNSLKNHRECHILIKPERIQQFARGMCFSCASFCVYVLSMVMFLSKQYIELSDYTEWIFSIGAITNMILGTLSSVHLTIYEFSAGFDVFYSRNKTLIVQQMLEKEKTTTI